MVVATRLDEMQASFELAKSEGFEAARTPIAEGRGRGRMGELRAVIDEMQQEEHKLLDLREQTNRSRFASALRTAVLSTLSVWRRWPACGTSSAGTCKWSRKRPAKFTISANCCTPL